MRSSILIVSIAVTAAFGCGKPTAPLPPDPPQVSLSPASTSLADSQLEVSLNVSGCDAVERLEVYESDTMVFPTSWSANPTKVQIPWSGR